MTAAERDEAKAKGIKLRYSDQLKQLGAFSTVEDFWRHYVHMKRPSQLPVDTNVYLFRDGCFPSWEVRLWSWHFVSVGARPSSRGFWCSQSYPAGGCWILKVKKNVGVIGKLWQDLVRCQGGSV